MSDHNKINLYFYVKKFPIFKKTAIIPATESKEQFLFTRVAQDEYGLYTSCSYILSTSDKGSINLGVTLRGFELLKEQSHDNKINSDFITCGLLLGTLLNIRDQVKEQGEERYLHQLEDNFLLPYYNLVSSFSSQRVLNPQASFDLFYSAYKNGKYQEIKRVLTKTDKIIGYYLLNMGDCYNLPLTTQEMELLKKQAIEHECFLMIWFSKWDPVSKGLFKLW